MQHYSRPRSTHKEMMKRIPRIRLDEEVIANRAEALGMIAYASDLPNTYMIRSEGEILITTRDNGYLRIDTEDLQALREELANIEEDLNRQR